ncbi:hypothetical protein [Cognatilysobacter lacus]|uniref:Uncharacterized protein n=1 Tax=Cognatilysobacter lacus TaxID=1643323 RepID=A0A5D8ZB01_9GAMM|nr:hypothetical protein [Lysobacter lacus]TZF89854.1 hypothetical protein FW784_07575 [Lysobacter lacus]
MLIYDRRRCRPLTGTDLRRALTLAQRAKLLWLESTGWRLLFVRGQPASVFLAHSEKGYATIVRDGRVLAVRSLTLRPGEGDGPRSNEPSLDAAVA